MRVLLMETEKCFCGEITRTARYINKFPQNVLLFTLLICAHITRIMCAGYHSVRISIEHVVFWRLFLRQV